MCKICETATSRGACPADFVGGSIGGTMGVIVGYPLDTVKTRLQYGIAYRSNLHAIRTILTHEGPRAIFKGVMAPMLSTAPMNGLIFGSYRSFLKLQLPHENATASLRQIYLAGVATGIVSCVLNTPVELLKIRQQMATAAGERVGTIFQTARDVVRTYGFKGLYLGNTTTMLRDTRFGLYFFTYEASSRALTKLVAEPKEDGKGKEKRIPPPWPILLFSGGLAGALGWVATFPFDVVKTRVQAGKASTNPLQAIREVYKAGGMRVFYRGLSATLTRAVPVNMVNFGVYEAVLYFLSN